MRHAPLVLLVLLVLLAGPWAGAVAAADPRAAGQEPRSQAEPGSAAAAGKPLTTRERLERMRSTGSRTGFDHDVRPRTAAMARQVGTGKRGAAVGSTEEAPEVAPRPTRWREESVGGTRVRQVRFRRQGEEQQDGP